MKSQVSISHREPMQDFSSCLVLPWSVHMVSVVMMCEELPAFLGPEFSLKIICGLYMRPSCSNTFEAFICQMVLLCRNSVDRMLALH